MGNRGDRAYMEIAIPEEIKSVLEKYKDDTHFTSFHKKYSDTNAFNLVVNKGLKILCASAGVKGVDTYTFRHTWATIAKNNCGASDEEVDFCLKHAPVHKLAWKYIKVDYSIIDKINRKVIDFVFNRRKRIERLRNIKRLSERTFPSKEK
jgi:integrase